MKHRFAAISVGVVAFASFGLWGCNDSNAPSMMSDAPAGVVASVTPMDGATGVPLRSRIVIRFTRPVDTGSVRRNFHLIGGKEMHDWMNDVHPERGFDHMSKEEFSSMMTKLDSQDFPGTFTWRPGLQECEFVTDSALAPQEDYMMIMFERGMMDRSMHSMGMMSGDNNSHNALMYHFETRSR